MFIDSSLSNIEKFIAYTLKPFFFYFLILHSIIFI